MNKKSPKQLRSDIERIRGKIQLVIDVLSRNTEERVGGLGDECNRTATELKKLLDENVLPSEYHVAVVGRFKAGKSSFVNEMLGRKLAGENTSPETAAVTTFRHGADYKAMVRFIDRTMWQSLNEMHKADPRDPDAHRVASWFKAGKPTDGGQPFDLAAIERKYVADTPSTEVIHLRNVDDNAQVKAFRDQLQLFTSSTKPHHCLVERIEITAPSPMLEEGVLLIDTPGLDDTQRFRVELTEKAVQNVDAILFLTKSGGSYGQSEKDFLLSLLRKGTVKQLVFIITQVDQTYDQHVAQQLSDDEEPEPIGDWMEKERSRVKAEIGATLDQLSDDDNSAAMQRYREQLGDIEIVFTSAKLHRNWQQKKSIEYPLFRGDPGGIDGVKNSLTEKLSTVSRLALTARNTESGARALLVRMLNLIDSRRQAVKNIKDREIAEQKLGMFRDQFGSACEEFSVLTTSDCQILKEALAAKNKLAEMNEQVVALRAESILAEFERDDVGRHWKRRRYGGWGYMHQLQTKVANNIFPTVAEMLQTYTQEFAGYLTRFQAHLAALSGKGNALAATLDLGEDIHIQVDERLNTFHQQALETAQKLLEAEEMEIISLLDNFVNEEVQERISEARDSVSNVFGTGTTWRQSSEVTNFYAQAKKILRDALTFHVRSKYNTYSEYLASEAQQLPGRAVNEAKAELSRVQENIRAAMEAAVHGQREQFDMVTSEINDVVLNAHKDIVESFGGDEFRGGAVSTEDSSQGHATQPIPEDVSSLVIADESLGILERISAAATAFVSRCSLNLGDSGWSYGRIFTPALLKGATTGLLVEPHISKQHQVKNLIDFLSTIQSATKIKSFWLITGPITDERPAGTDERFNELTRELFKQAGIHFEWRRETGLHDRLAVFNNGVLFKLGRGLDIFQPAGGLALNNQELRKVRGCSIDAFRVPSESA